MSTGRAATTPIKMFSVSVHVDAAPEVTFGILTDPRTHLEAMGKQAPANSFKLLTLASSDGPVQVGSVFSSTGSNMGMEFHDRSEVTELSAPRVFAFSTSARLVRKHRPEWQARFDHRYEVSADGTGSRIDYSVRSLPLNYRPYWLHPLSLPMTNAMMSRMTGANLRQFARLVERSATAA